MSGNKERFYRIMIHPIFLWSVGILIAALVVIIFADVPISRLFVMTEHFMYEYENKTVDKKELPAFLSQSEFVNAKREADLNGLKLDEKSLASLKKLILKLEEFEEVIENIAKNKTPYLLCKYALELSQDFHQFYNWTRVLSDNKEETKTMVNVVNSTKIVMANVLKLIGVSAPEKM